MIIRGIMVASTMSSVLIALFALVASSFRARAALQAEILALRHQLAVLHKNGPPRLRLQRSDRLWFPKMSSPPSCPGINNIRLVFSAGGLPRKTGHVTLLEQRELVPLP